MRKSFALLVAALLALAVLATGAAAHDDGGKQARGTSLTLHAVEDDFVAISREGGVLPEDEFAPQVGDRLVLTETVFADEARTEQVGRNHIECTFTEAEGEIPEEPPAGGDPPAFAVSFVCAGVLDLFGQGTLSWSGVTGFSSQDEPGPDEPFIVLAVTGGTSDLIGASGEVQVFEVAGAAEDEVLSRYEVTLLDRKGRR